MSGHLASLHFKTEKSVTRSWPHCAKIAIAGESGTLHAILAFRLEQADRVRIDKDPLGTRL